jgi:hypothetical protein
MRRGGLTLLFKNEKVAQNIIKHLFLSYHIVFYSLAAMWYGKIHFSFHSCCAGHKGQSYCAQ